MRLIQIAAAVSLLTASPVLAQDWIEFRSQDDRFGVTLPAAPTVRAISYKSWRGATLPARVYSVDRGGRYLVTVVDYATASDVTDLRGAIAFAAWNIRKRGGEITYDAFAQVDRIDGHELYIKNADGTSTLAGVFMHARRLYILEATTPPNAPPPLLFQQSLHIFDEKGERIRYELDREGNRAARVPPGCE
jgi:hypothetical protein